MGHVGKICPATSRPTRPAIAGYQARMEGGAWRDILEVLAEDLRERGQIDLSEGSIDGTFIVAKRGGSREPHQAG